MIDIASLTFDDWTKIGMLAGWVSPPVCFTHDGLPVSITEDAEFTDGSHPCIHILRIYETWDTKEGVEAYSFHTTWRNDEGQ